jgi:hypothetical protein
MFETAQAVAVMAVDRLRFRGFVVSLGRRVEIERLAESWVIKGMALQEAVDRAIDLTLRPGSDGQSVDADWLAAG